MSQTLDPQEQQLLDTAQRLSQMLTIGSMDWHRLKSNRKARALEQCAGAIVYLLKNQPDEALARLQQAVGWPCPTHGGSGDKLRH